MVIACWVVYLFVFRLNCVSLCNIKGLNEKGGKRDADDGPPVVFGIDTSGRDNPLKILILEKRP